MELTHLVLLRQGICQSYKHSLIVIYGSIFEMTSDENFTYKIGHWFHLKVFYTQHLLNLFLSLQTLFWQQIWAENIVMWDSK